jgi:hypothetical protein
LYPPCPSNSAISGVYLFFFLYGEWKRRFLSDIVIWRTNKRFFNRPKSCPEFQFGLPRRTINIPWMTRFSSEGVLSNLIDVHLLKWNIPAGKKTRNQIQIFCSFFWKLLGYKLPKFKEINIGQNWTQYMYVEILCSMYRIISANYIRRLLHICIFAHFYIYL